MKFWIYSLVFLTVYPYLIYPAVLVVISAVRRYAVSRKPTAKDFAKHDQPKVSFIVAFHNEEERLPEKIANTLACDYPGEKIEYLFVADGCDDRSEAIVEGCPEITLIRSSRVGKEKALALAIDRASGEVLVFSDVGVHTRPDAVSLFVENFLDPSCGAVSSYDQINDGRVSLEGAFVAMEMFIREKEAELSSCVGVSGSLFATRRDLTQMLRPDECSDLAVAFSCVRNGYRAVIDDRIHCVYRKAKTAAIELQRKRRTIIHGVTTVTSHFDLLNPLRYHWFSWQLLSHKLMRWLSPVAFTALIVTLLPLLILAVEIDGAAWEKWQMIVLTGVAGLLVLLVMRFENPRFAVVSTIAVYAAIFDAFRRKNYSQWKPTKRI
jgi:cellulose synthase/poly-beta-1,6-N-acetylglucosamine synthase-like glycosyltransferase